MNDIKETQKRIEELSVEIEKSANVVELAERAGLYEHIQQPAKAINDFIKILEIEPDNGAAKTKIEMLKTTMHYQNRDIYAHPNLDSDPWLD
ncbi:MAG: hypothetical protein U9R32_03045 [Bacteroidota bacterium]|nr:hypothetical protein [Bacteroidota bacterium]